jgi:hypothetical protein
MRLRLLGIAVAAGLLIALAHGRAQDNEVNALLDGAIKALGGEERIAKYQAGRLKAKGKIDLPGVGNVDMTQEIAFQLPDKFRQELQMVINGQNVNVATVYDGKKSALVVNNQKLPADDKLNEAMKEGVYQMQVGRLIILKDKSVELTSLGEAQVNGKPALGVRAAKKGHPDVNMFFDKASSLPVKVEWRTRDFTTGVEVTEERFISDYQTVEGMQSPRKVEVNRDGKRFIEAEVTEVQYLERLDDSEFAVQ